jgi:hypothetical protein
VSAPPFATTIGAGNDDEENGLNSDNSSDYGNYGSDSVSLSCTGSHDNVENNNSPDMPTDYDGIHSDLFENLFAELPTDINIDESQYCEPGTIRNGLFGPVLFPDLDHPASLPTLVTHSDDEVSTLPDIQKWLESLSKAYCVTKCMNFHFVGHDRYINL